MILLMFYDFIDGSVVKAVYMTASHATWIVFICFSVKQTSGWSRSLHQLLGDDRVYETGTREQVFCLAYLTPEIHIKAPNYLEKVDKFITWCKDNYSSWSVKKTKELDHYQFQKELGCYIRLQPVTVINGERVERVLEYKYLGAVLIRTIVFWGTGASTCHVLMWQQFRLRVPDRSFTHVTVHRNQHIPSEDISCPVCQ